MTNYRKNRHRVHKGFGEPSQRQQLLEMHRKVLLQTVGRVEAQKDLARQIEAVSDFETVDCGQMVNADMTPACDYRDLVLESPSGREIQFKVFDDRRIEWDGDLPAEVKQVAEGFV